MESQVYGAPVIGADIGGIPELVSDGETGELFESGNKSELKEKIEGLYNDEKRLDTYTKNCADAQFDTIEQYTGNLLEIYKGHC